MSRVGGGVRATGHARALLVELAAKLSDNFNLGSGQSTPAHPPLLFFIYISTGFSPVWRVAFDRISGCQSLRKDGGMLDSLRDINKN